MPTPEEQTGQPAVLYVGDHPGDRLVMQAMVRRRAGLHLETASSGRCAWRLGARLQPALLVLQSRLVDCHGVDLLVLLREHPGCRDVPAVLVTDPHVPEPNDAGFVDVWRRPLDLDTLQERLDCSMRATRERAGAPGAIDLAPALPGASPQPPGPRSEPPAGAGTAAVGC